MKTIYIVRHANAEGQPKEACLTIEGKQQSEQLAQFFSLKPIDKIYSSPFLRAIETIRPLAESRNIFVIQDERLSERVLSNRNFADWKEKLKWSFEDFDLVFEGGESSQSGFERAVSIVEEVIRNDDRQIVLVTHGNLMTLILRYFNEKVGINELFALTNPDVYEITIDEDRRNVKRIWE
jgi:2,3-bisphosphoglycerate-dependent phosphoglycerate mutase